MFGKIFASMFEGTLASRGPWEALVTFQQMIVLASRHGEVDMTPDALSRRTTIPLEIIQKGISALEQPDPHSRSDAEEGRRIVRLDKHRPWGWRIVNYGKYRDIQSAEDRRDYFKLQKRRKRAEKAANVHTVHSRSTLSTRFTDAEADAEAVRTKPCANPSGSHDGLPSEDTPPSKTNALELEAVSRVWSYYLQKLDKNPKLLSFTGLRKQKGLARFGECLAKTGGDLAKAEALMRLAIDALAASAFHRGENDRKRRYDSWEGNLFKSQEQLEAWLERAL